MQTQAATTSVPLVPQRYLRTRDAAAYIGLSAWKLRDLVAGGHIKVIRVPGSDKFTFDKNELDRFMQAHQETAPII